MRREPGESESSVRGWQRAGSEHSMKKESVRPRRNDLRPEYDLSRLKRGVRGKYYKQAAAGTNLVLLDPDLTYGFPDSASVNRALRVLQDVATRTSTRTKKSTRSRRNRTG